MVRRMMLALLGAVMLVGPATVQGETDGVRLSRLGTSADRGRTAVPVWNMRLLPVALDARMPATSAAPPAGKGYDALDNPTPTAVPTSSGQTGMPDSAIVERRVPITFYSCLGPRGGFCGAMSSGKAVYEGAAACGSAYTLGDRVSIVGDPTGRVYVCEDRGRLAPTQVDVFWHREEDGRAWIAQVGRWADVRRDP